MSCELSVVNYDDYMSFVAKLASKYSADSLAAQLGTAALGLTGEASEVEEIVGEITSGQVAWSRVVRDDLIKELGDAMWYIAFTRKFITGTTRKIADLQDHPEPWDFIDHPRPGDPTSNLVFGSRKLVVAAGKFADIVKKQLYHGVEYTETICDVLQTYVDEAYDAVCFIATAGLGCTINEIIDRNVEKLRVRYEGLEFSTEASLAKADEKVA